MGDQSMQHRLTWLAIILTFILLVPCAFIGYIVGYAYQFSLGWMMGDGLADWITDGWATIILLKVFTNMLRGAIGGWLAMFVCSKILKQSDYHIVAYTNSALVIAFTLIGLAFGFAHGFRLTDLAMVSNTVGIVVALFICAAEVGRKQQGEAEALVAAR